MLFVLAVAIVLVAVLVLVVLMRRGGAGNRGDLLGPPSGVGTRTRVAPPQPSKRADDSGAREVGASLDNLPDDVVTEARVLLKHNQKIEAIKLIRAHARCQLGEAKEWCERQ